MKFGKHLQTRQLDIPEYAASFVNYKALKKLIKQLSATPTLGPQHAGSATDAAEPQAALQANRDKFFFRLERELEKVNAFYLQKEAELKLRLQTLQDKKRSVQTRRAAPSKQSVTFVTLQEGFQQFAHDLNKLQQFVEVNNTAFAKILKKWDKTSKSRTKELYLSRAVEVQPCFNRDVISDFSDQATASLQELAAWAEGEHVMYDAENRPGQAVGQIISSEGDDTDTQILHSVKSGNQALLQEWVTRLRSSPDAQERFTRIFLSAIADAPLPSLSILVASGLVDVQAEDDINGRNCLHEASISGKQEALQLGLSSGVNVSRADIYGRIPLHYACMYGYVDMVPVLLQADPHTINDLDHDAFTPLIQSIVHHHLECVRQLLAQGARVEPGKETDHIPLNLACQHDSTEIIKLLLEQRARLLPDAEGLFPQHLVARSGQSAESLLLLKDYGANLDQRDKLYQWTPLFHAASEGYVGCMQTLLNCGVDASLLDEKGYSALYYATWEGHLECMNLLSGVGDTVRNQRKSVLGQSFESAQEPAAPAPSDSIAPQAADADGIPDFTLPPPIIPLRRYGHNFLDNKTFIQLTFESLESDAIVFYQGSKYPAARLTISPKSSDALPRNIMLPLQEDARIVSFQIDNVSSFAIDFDIYPAFGSRIIARSIVLPSTFTKTSSGFGSSCLPLFDTRLRAIGQISFSFQVIEPFRGLALDITHFATYWRATQQLDSYPTGLITGSSLTGEYVQLFVQVTADGVPVLYPHWTVDHHGLGYPITRLTYQQYLSLASRGNGSATLDAILADEANGSPRTTADLAAQLSRGFLSLKDVLARVPTSVNVDLEVLYPTEQQKDSFGFTPACDLNAYADAILKDVFDHARTTKEHSPNFMRSIVFSSYNPDVCTALNWKQPNYPVLLRDDLGADRRAVPSPQQASFSTKTNSQGTGGQHSLSVKDAVRIAQTNNFMGLICTSQVLNAVPSLIESIKVAGLVLIVDSSTDTATSSAHATAQRSQAPSSLPDGIDGVLRSNGILRFNEVIDM